MRIIRHKSAIPVYIAAGVWLLASLLLPMARLWQLLLYAAIAVGAALIGEHFFPGTEEQLPIPEAEPDSGNAAVDSLLKEGRIHRDAMAEVCKVLRNPQALDSGRALCGTTDRILKALEEDPDRIDRAKKFLSYYLPTTENLLKRYQELEKKDVAEETRARMLEMLPKLCSAFETQLNQLYEEETMDIRADMQVMQQLMEAEGLLKSDNQL